MACLAERVASDYIYTLARRNREARDCRRVSAAADLVAALTSSSSSTAAPCVSPSRCALLQRPPVCTVACDLRLLLQSSPPPALPRHAALDTPSHSAHVPIQHPTRHPSKHCAARARPSNNMRRDLPTRESELSTAQQAELHTAHPSSTPRQPTPPPCLRPCRP